MKVGDKKQATILFIVAIGAIAFLAIQLVPGEIKSPLGGLAASANQTGGPALATELPLMVAGDPFSHPKLATKPAPKEQPAEPPRDINTGYGPFSPPGLGNPNSEPNSAAGPEESAGNSQQKPQGPQIALMAVMQAGTPVAMLQVGSNQPKNYAEGEIVADNVRLIKVADSYVLVRVYGTVHRIATGDTYQPDHGESK